jgi:hypothetical protein
MLFFRDTNWDKEFSPAMIQESMARLTQWIDDLSERGILKSAAPLMSEGKIVTGKKGSSVADGPFAESKEAIGGYFLLETGSYEEAIKLTQTCPTLDYGAVLELRPVAAICPTMQRANELLANAAA